MEQTIRCKICGKPYKVYSHYAGDQSACPECVRQAEVNSWPIKQKLPPGLGKD